MMKYMFLSVAVLSMLNVVTLQLATHADDGTTTQSILETTSQATTSSPHPTTWPGGTLPPYRPPYFTKLGEEYTELHYAASRGDLDLIIEMVNSGIPVDSQSNTGATPLYTAMFHRNLDAVELLVKLGADIDRQDTIFGGTALNQAALSGWSPAIVKLLDLGANIEAKNKYGATTLHVAVRNRQYEAVELLVKLGANVDERKTTFNRTALIQAGAAGQDLAIITLLDLGANIEMKDIFGNTALNMAATKGHPRSVQVLMDYGADIHSRDYNGNSPLHDAAWSGRSNTVEVLLKAGASPFKLDKQGKTPLADAELRSKHNRDYDGTIRLLKAAMHQQNS